MYILRSVYTKGDKDNLEIKYKAKIQAARDGGAEPADDSPTDDRVSAIAKFIPAESVAIFIGIFGLFSSAAETTPVEWIGFGTFVFCLLLAIFLTYTKASREKVKIAGEEYEIPKKYVKTALAAIAFVIWAINIEGFVAIIKGAIPLYDPIIGQALIIGYTILIPSLYAEMTRP